MTRSAALEVASRLAASSGLGRRCYFDAPRHRWRFTEGYFLVPSYYSMTPEGKATEHHTGAPLRGYPVSWRWSNPRLA